MGFSDKFKPKSKFSLYFCKKMLNFLIFAPYRGNHRPSFVSCVTNIVSVGETRVNDCIKEYLPLQTCDLGERADSAHLLVKLSRKEVEASTCGGKISTIKEDK